MCEGLPFHPAAPLSQQSFSWSPLFVMYSHTGAEKSKDNLVPLVKGCVAAL